MNFACAVHAAATHIQFPSSLKTFSAHGKGASQRARKEDGRLVASSSSPLLYNIAFLPPETSNLDTNSQLLWGNVIVVNSASLCLVCCGLPLIAVEDSAVLGGPTPPAQRRLARTQKERRRIERSPFHGRWMPIAD